jgi:hypothetical protein
MRVFVHLVLIYGLLSSSAALGQEPPRFGQADVAAIDQLFDRYYQAFASKDYAKLRDYLRAPFILDTAGDRGPAQRLAPFVGLGTVLTLEGVIDSYQVLRDSLDAQAYERSQTVQRRITALSHDRALVNSVYQRYRKDGTVLVEAAAVYVVTKSAGAWKVSGILAQEVGEFGNVY